MHFDCVHFHTRKNMSASAVCHQFRAPAGAGRIRRAANRSARAAKVRTASERTRHVSRPDRSASRSPEDPDRWTPGNRCGTRRIDVQRRRARVSPRVAHPRDPRDVSST
jgi:hypothetical protein